MVGMEESDKILCACRGREFGELIEHYHKAVDVMRTIQEIKRDATFIRTIPTFIDSSAKILNMRCGFNIDRANIIQAGEDIMEGRIDASQEKILEASAQFGRKCGERPWLK